MMMIIIIIMIMTIILNYSDFNLLEGKRVPFS